MKHRSKPVAALAVALLIVPAAGAASCFQGMQGMAGHSDRGMIGMPMPDDGDSISSAFIATCCVDSPAEITPLLLPRSDAAAVPLLLVPALHFSQPVMRLVLPRTLHEASPPAQAVLCVFLI